MLPRRSDFTTRGSHVRAVASEMARPALSAVVRLACGPGTPRSAWRRGLIVAHSHIGDVLYRTGSLGELHEAMPHVEWDFLTSNAAQSLLDHNPAVRAALPFVAGSDGETLADGARDKLRHQHYDVVLCSNTFRVVSDFALAVTLRAPNRFGVGHKGATGLLSRTVSIGEPAPYPVYFRRMVEQVSGCTFTTSVRPRINLTASDRAEAADVLRHITVPPGSQLVACTLSTRQSGGSWPTRFFTDALGILHARTGIVALVGGAPHEAPELQRVAASLPFPAHVVAGRLSLRGFAALVERCALLLSPDSGPRHVANAVGTPVVFARNLAAPAIETGCYCDTETDVAPAGLGCLAGEARLQAVQSVPPERAADAMQRWLHHRRSR